jgi:sialidase-1
MKPRRIFLKKVGIGSMGVFLLPNFTIFNQNSFPKKPTKVRTKPASASHFIVEWKDNSINEQGFRIERREKDGVWDNVGIVGSGMTQYFSTGCIANTYYDHRVIAFNEDGESISETVSGITLDKLTDRRCKIIETSSVRQGEGTFLKLKNGNLELYYSEMETTSDLAEAKVSKKVSIDNGKTWSKKQIVFEEKGFALFLPGAVRLPNGNVGITYVRRVPGKWFSKRVFRYSTDEGKTWSDEIVISDNTYDYSTGSHDRIYRLSNGNIVVLVHSVKGEGEVRPRELVTDVYLSNDNGRKWQKMTQNSLSVPHNPYKKGEFGFWEAAIAELENGKIIMFGRTATTWLYGCESIDYGKFWTQPKKINIPQPLSPPYLFKIPGTDLIIFLNNPIIEKDHHLLGNRYVLSSIISNDNGKTWKNYRQVEYHSHEWWYDYPNVLCDGDNIHISMRVIKLTKEKRWDKVYLGYLKLSKKWFK